MPSLKLTKTTFETARPQARDYELRDTTLAGFICKVTPAGRKVFMLSYRTPTGERRKPSLGVFGAPTVNQARKLAQEHLAAVRAGEDPSAERQALRGADREGVERALHGGALSRPQQAQLLATEQIYPQMPHRAEARQAQSRRGQAA